MPRTSIAERNLLRAKNSGFETAPTFIAATTTSNKFIDGSAAGITALASAYRWAIISGTTNGTFSAQFDNTFSHSGSSSIKLSTGAVSSALEVGLVTAISLAGGLLVNGIPVSGSTQYTARFWMKTDLISGSSTNGASMNFNERNVSAGGSVSNQSSKITTTTAWTQYSITFTTASATRFIVPRLQCIGTGGAATLIMNAWFDDIELYPTTVLNRTATT